MIPTPRKTLSDIATRIVTHLVPDLQSEYGQADGGLITALLLTLAQDYERAVFNRMTDIEEMQALFGAHLDKRADADQADSLRAYMSAKPETLMLDDVTKLHARGFELLIELHAWSEQHDAELDGEIWRFLRRHSERNRFDIPGP